MTATYWGPHFPVDTSYWDGHFPDEAPSTGVPAYGDKGAATFALDLENGFKVKHKWVTDIEKYFSAKERRYARNDAPQESYEGSAILLENQPRDIRTTLAASAPLGSQFAFALPHEALLVTAVAGNTVSVQASQLALTDWARMGQRCVVKWLDDDNNSLWQDAVIQSVVGAVVTLDIAPNADAMELMPVRPCFLDPQQSFPRYPVNAEVWQLVARAALFDFAPTQASIPIRSPFLDGPLTGAIAYTRAFGDAGNTKHMSVTEAEGFGEPGALVSEDDTTTELGIDPIVTTLADFKVLLDSSSNFFLGGTYDPTQVLDGDMVDTVATGGSTGGDVGTGASLTIYDDGDTAFPVWDRKIAVETTAADSLQAMTHIVDHGALAHAIGTTPRADWGRAVSIKHGDRDVWQWLKKFTSTVRGAMGPFWLPTWRNDMDFVSKAAGTITVSVEALGTWWPTLRDRLQIIESDGTITFAKITAATDNHDGTWTLTIIDGAGDPITLASSNVDLISWLELCRFENDEFEFIFGEKGVAFSATARAIDNIVTDGQPREYAAISYGTTTHRMSFTTRDLLVDGVLYPVVGGARSAIGVGSLGSYKDVTITIPIDHAFVTRYLAKGIPPGKITATIWREEIGTDQWFTGEIDGISFDENCVEATFKVISKGSKVSLRVIPSVVDATLCPHTLFEGFCGRGISRDGTNTFGIPYKQTATVIAITDNRVRIDLTNVPIGNVQRPRWCIGGEFIHTASGERRSIRDQNDLAPGVSTVTVIDLHLPIVELHVGDSVDVYPGCDHELRGDYGCNIGFGNRQNFGGLPALPDVDPFIVGHLVT